MTAISTFFLLHVAIEFLESWISASKLAHFVYFEFLALIWERRKKHIHSIEFLSLGFQLQSLYTSVFEFLGLIWERRTNSINSTATAEGRFFKVASCKTKHRIKHGGSASHHLRKKKTVGRTQNATKMKLERPMKPKRRAQLRIQCTCKTLKANSPDESGHENGGSNLETHGYGPRAGGGGGP